MQSTMSKQIRNPYLSPSKKQRSDLSIVSAPETSQTSFPPCSEPVRQNPIRNPYLSPKKVLSGALNTRPTYVPTPKKCGENCDDVCLAADDALIVALETAEKSRLPSQIVKEPFMDGATQESPSPSVTISPILNPYKTTAVKKSPIIVNPYLKKNADKVSSRRLEADELNVITQNSQEYEQNIRNISLITPIKAGKDDEFDCLDDALLLQALDTAEKIKDATKRNSAQNSKTTAARSLQSVFDAAIPTSSSSSKPLTTTCIHQKQHQTLRWRLISMRTALDKYVRQLALKHHQYVPHSLVDAIDVLRTTKIIPMELADGMHEIQWLGYLAQKNGDVQLPCKSTIDSLIYKYREQKQKYENSLIPRERKIY
jgi:hypothetical protein